jgi:hypothetical protein
LVERAVVEMRAGVEWATGVDKVAKARSLFDGGATEPVEGCEDKGGALFDDKARRRSGDSVNRESRWACANAEWVALVVVTAGDEEQMGWVYYMVRSESEMRKRERDSRTIEWVTPSPDTATHAWSLLIGWACTVAPARSVPGGRD